MKSAYLSLVILLSLFQISSAAVFNSYQPLANINGTTAIIPSDAGSADSGLSVYLNNLYTLGVSAAAALAVIMVIWGGIQYITSVAGEGKSGGKERITSAILGLLLALGSYIILSTVNKDLLKLTFNLPDSNVDLTGTQSTTLTTTSNGAGNTTQLQGGGTLTTYYGGGYSINGKYYSPTGF